MAYLIFEKFKEKLADEFHYDKVFIIILKFLGDELR
jgi:hypothetical protein